MASVFGTTFIADDKETAKLISLENNVQRFNCVTLEGDSYRSDGVLSGGANKQKPLLPMIEKYIGFDKNFIQIKNKR